MKNLYPGLMAFLCFLILAHKQGLHAQCSPALSQTCNATNLLCALDELNGFVCSNTSTVASSCSPICSQGGNAENTSWWGFMGNGGNISVTLDVGTCNNNQGLEFGILRGCNCANSVACKSLPCVSPGSSWTINASVQKCVSYYLWIDGCNGDVCDFTISTTGGGTPELDPLGYINNQANQVIQVPCAGCYHGFSINQQSNECNAYFKWDVYGQVIEEGYNNNLIEIIFPDNREFEMCVTVFLRNPDNPNEICSQQGPQCATIKVGTQSEKIGKQRFLCYEMVNPYGFTWHSQRIFTSGVYREKLQLKGSCCIIDSVVQFTVMEETFPSNHNFISCDGEAYTDILGRKQSFCLIDKLVKLPKTTKPFACDSSIFLTSINANFAPSWENRCFGGMVEHIPNIRIINRCELGEVYEFDYSWYKKSDTSQVISKDERMLVPAISEDYVLKVTVITQINGEISFCHKTYYEKINESDIIPECFPIVGNKVYCFEPLGNYHIDGNILFPVKSYHWRIEGGQIISNPDSQYVNVLWNLNVNDTGKICASYEVDCGLSCEECFEVILDSKITGNDFEQRGLTAYLQAKAHPRGIWRVISGPYGVQLFDPTNPRTQVSVFNYGYYCFEWSVTHNNCTIRDTLCIDFYFAKRASPEYPKNEFLGRNRIAEEKNDGLFRSLMPTLIFANQSNVLSANAVEPMKLSLSWYDVYGNPILKQDSYLDEGWNQLEVQAPGYTGIYFVSIHAKQFKEIIKVCVLNK